MLRLIAAIACSRGSTPLMAKKQVCMIVLTRPPMPVSRATRSRVDDVEAQALLANRSLHLDGQMGPDLSGAIGAVEQEDAHQAPPV